MQHMKASKSSAEKRQDAAKKRPMDLKAKLDASASLTRKEDRTFSIKEVLDPYWSWRFVRMSGL
jgi:hypothetical protein